MTEPDPASAQAEVNIDAEPDKVYQLITDLPTLASLAEELQTMDWHKGDAARPGAVFKGHNRNGVFRWSTKCTVTEAEPGRRFAFDVRYLGVPVAHWRYDIIPTERTDGAGCRVTEGTWDRRPGWFAKTAWIGTGVRDRDGANADHIKLTLQRLKEKAETR
jgi:Polyketide cyclase / dehydrase and lipid transport